jgi:hypothetical protein
MLATLLMAVGVSCAAAQEPAAGEGWFTVVPVKAGAKGLRDWKVALHNAAIRRLDAARAYYESGQIAIDRYLQAVEEVTKTGLAITVDDAGRVEVRRRAMEVLKDVVERERVRFDVGSGSSPNITEAEFAYLQATVAYHEAKGTPDGELPPVPETQRPAGAADR